MIIDGAIAAKIKTIKMNRVVLVLFVIYLIYTSKRSTCQLAFWYDRMGLI